MNIQNYPIVDSAPTEPFESLVEMYYQLKGYITSTNKWFWVWESNKQQRGYQDIDALAINRNETLIISVTTNLDDKVRFDRNGQVKTNMLNKTEEYFKRVVAYLENINEYKWIVGNGRKVRMVIAYVHGYRKDSKKMIEIENKLKTMGIELLSAEEIIGFVKDQIKAIEEDGLKTNNPLVKLIQLLDKYGGT